MGSRGEKGKGVMEKKKEMPTTARTKTKRTQMEPNMQLGTTTIGSSRTERRRSKKVKRKKKQQRGGDFKKKKKEKKKRKITRCTGENGQG